LGLILEAEMKLIVAALLLLAAGSPACAKEKAINLSTWPKKLPLWKVYEVSGGQLVSSKPVYIGKTYYGAVPGITMPFSDNDGFWYAQTVFTLPPNATNPMLKVVRVGVDDRAVIQLNGVSVTGVGTASGNGYMQFSDPGSNVPFTFVYGAGPVPITWATNFQPGANTLTVIVNNTEAGISGHIKPPSPGDATNMGIQAYITYDTQ
jgi:hypothetical protein